MSALNANVFGVVVIGLGCETVGHKELADKIRKLSDKPVVSFGIQEEGGTIKTAALAVEAARKMVEEASKQQKVECDASDLFVAIECGGSDATSGIASNPAVGNMADTIYDLGGTTMMSETVEFIGAEHVLAKRGETPEIHDQIIRICEDYDLSLTPKSLGPQSALGFN